MRRLVPRIEAYRDEDEPAVLDLLTTALGRGPTGRRSPGFFRWKHMASPFGRSFMLVARDGARIVGLRAFLRWEFVLGGRTVAAVRAVDTATHPDHQGRGVFSRLTAEAVETLRSEVDLIFNTPNESSGPGYLKLGWRAVGRIPVGVRVRRPVRFAARLPSLRESEAGTVPPSVKAPPAGEVLGRAGRLVASLRPDPSRLSTPRRADYLRWRYGDAPFDYRAVAEPAHGEPAGVAVFRLRGRGRLWEASVAEVLIPPGDSGIARRLLARVARASEADHLAGAFPSRSEVARAARLAGFAPTWGGPRLMVNPLAPSLGTDPTSLRSWALTLGDVEVF